MDIVGLRTFLELDDAPEDSEGQVACINALRVTTRVTTQNERVCAIWKQNETDKQSDDNHNLENIYTTRVMVPKAKRETYDALLGEVMNTLIERMKDMSHEFRFHYLETYCGGSHFDGLKVDSTHQEFDLNIVFKWDPENILIKGLGLQKKKRNFCFLETKRKRVHHMHGRILTRNQYGRHNISPGKMFDLLLHSINKALPCAEGEILKIRGKLFQITRQVNTPITLKVIGLSDNMFFTVDLVPAIKIPLENLQSDKYRKYRNLSDRVKKLSQIGTNDASIDFMAISLNGVSSEKFQLDFHDVERTVMHNRGCAKKVTKMIKYLRDRKGGPMEKIWSFLIKVSF
jgi:hypothetical protein